MKYLLLVLRKTKIFWKTIIDRIKNMQFSDLVIFFIIMFAKAVFFNLSIKARNMSMNFDDVLVAIGTLAMVTFWTLWLPRKGRMIALLAMNIIFTGIMFADLLYFRYFQDIISIPVLLQANQVGALGGSIFTLIHLVDISFFIDWSLIAFFAIKTYMRNRKLGKTKNVEVPKISNVTRYRRMLIRFSLSLILLAFGTTLVFIPVTQAKNTWASRLFVSNFWNVSLYNVTGIIGFHGYDFYRYAEENWLNKKQPLSLQEISDANQFFKKRGQIRKQLQSDPLFGAYKGKNVIMVQLETYQNYLIGLNINGKPLTPNLNSLTQNSVYFNNFFHQTAQGRTSDADLGANFSLQPLQTGSVFIRYPSSKYDALATIMKEQNYGAYVFHAYEPAFWNRSLVYKNVGYDQFFSKPNFTIDEPVGWSLGDKSFFRQSVDIMATKQQPFYSFLIALSTHNPYTLPEDMEKFDVGPLQDTILGNYLQAAHYVDEAVGDLVTDLKAKGLWQNSVVIMYGDHDTSITDMSLYETLFGRTLGEQEFTRMMREVPLFIHLPDEKYKGTRTEIGGQLDLSPTILHLLGVKSENKYLLGTPLLIQKPLANKKVIFRNGSYTDGRVWFIPAEDGVEENDRCLDATTGEPLERTLCTGKADVENELKYSNELVEYNLIPTFRP